MIINFPTIPKVGQKVKLTDNDYVKSRLERPTSNLFMSSCLDKVGTITAVITPNKGEFMVRVDYEDTTLWDDFKAFTYIT